MSSGKYIEVAGLGSVRFQKRKNARNIRITVSHAGETRVSLPTWVPYKAAIVFAESKKDWIISQSQGKSRHVFSNGERVGKSHRLRLVTTSALRTTTRVTDTEIVVFHPESLPATSQEVQRYVSKAATKALRNEAEKLLLPRLRSLAAKNGFTFKTAEVKVLKTRWGSCSSEKAITLNCYLMQLPWDLIDYVLLHELVHTEVMAHGPRFWTKLDKHVTNLPVKRKTMKSYHPALSPQD